MVFNIEEIDFEKSLSPSEEGLVPAVVQNYITGQVLMLGYMNKESLELTIKNKKVTFYSRSKKRIWCKGETSGNFLEFVSLSKDCDNDSILIQSRPQGPTCHKGTASCFLEEDWFLGKLEKLIDDRKDKADNSSSDDLPYTSKLFQKGTPKIAQKVGEEGVEVVIEAIRGKKKKLTSESADLIFHLLVLLKQQKLSIEDVLAELAKRNSK